MTDGNSIHVRVTRRVALKRQYEFYEVTVEGNALSDLLLDQIEAFVEMVRKRDGQGSATRPRREHHPRAETDVPRGYDSWAAFIDANRERINAKREEMGADLVNDRSAAMLVAREMRLIGPDGGNSLLSFKVNDDGIAEFRLHVPRDNDIPFKEVLTRFKEVVHKETGSWPKWNSEATVWEVDCSDRETLQRIADRTVEVDA